MWETFTAQSQLHLRRGAKETSNHLKVLYKRCPVSYKTKKRAHVHIVIIQAKAICSIYSSRQEYSLTEQHPDYIINKSWKQKVDQFQTSSV